MKTLYRPVARRSRWLSAAAAGVLTVSMLAACSSDDDGSDSSDSTDVNDTAGTSETDTAGSAAAGSDNSDDSADGNADDTPSTGGATEQREACTTGDLDITFGQTQGAAGSTIVDLELANDSEGDCSVTGYPGIALVDENGDVIGKPAERDGSSDPEEVHLAPGDIATVAVEISNAGNYDDAACGPTPAHGLQVIPPNDTENIVVDFAAAGDGSGPSDVTGCSSDDVKLLGVQPAQHHH